ncbi:MAG: putative lipid II flippase FtsW [Pseudomonas sp.]|jgi:cell division protein FtsW|nr:putative lipid II flippase FtsW [Pseudomonas sp.]MDD2221964.1 putative lipid II flippase FtsW [Pseudomonas sp.]MDY0413302.1 putative lipid II flippase FtsW [Pseudomonas sp.]NLO53050.1 putative lipid II flippase FtsW [Gammaproteobacteria bacterium]
MSIRDAFALPSPWRHNNKADIDFPLLAACALLMGIGLVMIASASSAVADTNTGNTLYYFIRHMIYIVVALIAGGLTLFVPMSVWQRYSGWLLLFAFVVLILVLVPGVGREVNGSKRWIGVGIFNIQPTELAKLFMVIFIAGFLVRRKDEVKQRLRGLLKPLLVAMAMALLIYFEPDFGAMVVMLGSVIVMLYLGGVRLLLSLPLLGILLGGLVYVVRFESYRMARLTSFTNPWEDQYGAGYQLTQALIAFGRGEWFGLGLGNSIQKQFFLPEAHTDFVFSVLAEELGMVGALTTLGLFVFVSVRALFIGVWAEQAKQYYSAYVAYGLSLLWIGQVVINLGVNVGLLPTKGLTLPFISYGGSSLVVCCISLAILLRIEWERRTQLLSANSMSKAQISAMAKGVRDAC